MIAIAFMPILVAAMIGVVVLMRRNEERKAAAKRKTLNRIMQAGRR